MTTAVGDIEIGIDPVTFRVVINHPAVEIAVTPDEALTFAEVLRKKAEEVWEEKAKAAPIACHGLRFGFPVCGFARTFPVGWPEGHTWVGIRERNKITCTNCQRVLAQEIFR